MAGEVYSITGSLEEALAVWHANVARKLAGSATSWDAPMDLRTSEAVAVQLAEQQRLWHSSLEETMAQPRFSENRFGDGCLDFWIGVLLRGRIYRQGVLFTQSFLAHYGMA